MSEKHDSFILIVAKIVRVLTVPPVMVAALLTILCVSRDGFFPSVGSYAVSLICLAGIPVLAYPVSVLIPPIRRKGREGQRHLAMAFSVVGYVSVFLYGLFAGVGRDLMLIYSTYLLSVLLISLSNFLLHIRASGHACSVTGPLVLSGYFLGWIGAVVGVLLWCGILWASLVSHRHTVKEFLFGTGECLISFGLSLLAVFLLA